MNENVSIQLTRGDIPLYIQLSEYYEKLIIEGKLKAEEKLPPIRKLAALLEVNNVTVVNAYKLLEQKGYVYTKKGSGIYVAAHNEQESQGLSVYGDESEFFEEDDIHLMNSGQIVLTENSINFASATPASDLFPVEDFKQVLMEVFDRDKGSAFGYDESNGYRPLRCSISRFLDEHYAIKAHQDEIQIISGAQQGIDVIAKALIQPGDYVLVENPTYTGALAVFKSRGAKIIGVPMAQDGVNMDMLEKFVKIYRPKLMYTMPNYQNPTTFCYAEQKKKYLLELASRHNFFIIEDDFLTDLNFNKHDTYQTLKALDRNDSVLYIKSFSKVLMPGLRMGFLIAPTQVFREILQAKHTTDISSSGLIQRAFDLYLEKNIWGKHLQYMKKIYNNRYQKMIQELSKLEELGVRYHAPNGGLNIWLTLPDDISSTKLYQACAQKDVMFIPGKIFYVGNTGEDENNIRISYAAVYPEQIEKGIEVMYDCMKRLKDKKNEKSIFYSPLI